ncbi:Uncharacterised protein [Mycobacteroides abscessus subsp. abscessus]|nr:Uncharacterised protein [Mycobacteroides abscessus subsp. abscessus]
MISVSLTAIMAYLSQCQANVHLMESSVISLTRSIPERAARSKKLFWQNITA